MREIIALDLICTTEDGTFDIEDWLAYKEGLV